MAESCPNVRMHEDVAVASINPLPSEQIPTYDALVSGEAFENGWIEAYIFASVRRALRGIDRTGHLFGELDIYGSSSSTLSLKNGETVSIPDDSHKLFSDAEHVVVRPVFSPQTFYNRYIPGQNREAIGLTAYKAFALVPYKFTKGGTFAKSIKQADPYSTSKHWKRYIGLLLTDRPN